MTVICIWHYDPQEVENEIRGSALGIMIIPHSNTCALAQASYYAGQNLHS